LLQRNIIWNTRIHSYGNSCIGGLVGIGIAFSKYIKQNQVPAADAERSTVSGVYNKYYVDEAYDTIFVKTTNGLSRFFRDHVETTLSSLVLIGKQQRNRLSRKKIQTGSIGFYLFVFVLGTMCHLTYLFIVNNFIL
jgi:NADH-quinone oxidoreductase subunit L